MPRTEYNDPEAEKHFQEYLPRLNEGVSVAEKDKRPGKGDKVENQTKDSSRYGGGDLPTARKGSNERHYYEVRD